MHYDNAPGFTIGFAILYDDYHCQHFLQTILAATHVRHFVQYNMVWLHNNDIAILKSQ